jgi:hypothetical protein
MGVTHVAMESTGVYWKAPYYLRRQRDHAVDHNQRDRAQLFTELLDGIDDSG